MLTSEKLIHKQSILMSDNGFQWDEAVEGMKRDDRTTD